MHQTMVVAGDGRPTGNTAQLVNTFRKRVTELERKVKIISLKKSYLI